ncbi:adhesion G-protein coupled receptor G7 isoform X2 [Epinephelus lanceolatus]
MDSLLLFTLVVHLAPRAGAQSTTSTTVVPVPAATTSAILPTTTTTTVPLTSTSPTTNIPSITTMAIATTSDLISTTSYFNTTTSLTTASDFPSTTTITTSAYPPGQPTSMSHGTILPTLTTGPGGTPLTPEGSSLTPGGINQTTVPEGTTPDLTTIPEGTTLSPGGSNLTTVSRGTLPTPEGTTLFPGSTTPTPAGSNLTTVPESTILSTRSESTSTAENTGPTNSPNTAPVATTDITLGTDLPSDNTTVLTTATFYPTTGQTTTTYDPNSTSGTSSNPTETSYYPTAATDFTTTTTTTPFYPTNGTDFTTTTPATELTNGTDIMTSTTPFYPTNGTEYPTTTTPFYPTSGSDFTTTTTPFYPTNGTEYPTTTTPFYPTNGTDFTTTMTPFYPTNGTDFTTTTPFYPTNGTEYPTTTTTPFYPTNGTDFTTTTTTTDQTSWTDYTTTAAPTTTTDFPTSTTPAPATPPPTTTTPAPTTPPPTTTTTTTTPHPTTTTTTPPTTTPLVCDNGGISVSGVCICPDEWTGMTCSEENFCQAQELGEFKFPRTPIGWFAYSEEVCPKGSSGAGKPRASTRCSTKNGPPSLEHPPQVLQCDQTLSDIQQNLTSSADLEMLATSTQILTSKPEELTAENITAAAQIANTLLLSPNVSESVRVAAVATVSQLLNTSTPDDGKENNATLGLTVTLDQLSVNLSLSLNVSQSQVVQPNLVVQSVQIPAADTQGVQFTSFSGTSGNFIADRIQLNTNTSTVVVENGFIADALIYIRFPPEDAVRVHQQPSNVSLGFVLYQNDRFFRSRRYRRRHATIRVLSATVRGQGRSVVPQHVEMLFRPTVMDGTSLFDFACVFWDYSLEDWSTAGCSKGNASDGLLRCFCNHTTNFAALWSFRENYEYAEALNIISIVGLSLSILGLVVTIIHHLKDSFQTMSRERQNYKNSKLALLCICVSLLAFIITFLSGITNRRQLDGAVEVDTKTNTIPGCDEHVEPDGGSCTAVAALLHFFLLATFTWTSLYGTQLVILVRTMRQYLPPFWTPLSVAVGWGVPAVSMATTLAVSYRVDNPLGYRQEEFCWLAALDKNKHFDFKKPMFWGFLLPLGLILIYNIIMVVLVSLTTCRTNPALNSTKRLSLWKKFLTSLSLVVLLGLSWSLGYLQLVTTEDTHLTFSILFCLCTTTQGFQIFVLFTARTPSFRATVSRSVQYVSSVNISLKETKYKLQRTWATSSTESYKDLRDFRL